MKNTFLILAILVSHLSYAQTTRSIEIKVKDTVELKVKSADMKISIPQAYSYEEPEYDYSYDEYEDSEYDEEYDYESEYYYNHLSKKEKRRAKKANRKLEKEMKKWEKSYALEKEEVPMVTEEISFDEVISIDSAMVDYSLDSYDSYNLTLAERKAKWITYLTQNNIPFDTLSSDENSEYYDYESFNIQLRNLTLDQIQLMNQYEDSVYNTYTSITKMNFESLDSKMDEVYADLYKKAQTQANSLAKVIGATPGKVIRVYEPAIDVANIGEAYSELLKELMKKNDYSTEMESKTTSVERIFVFEIK
ncbi:MAG: hypothetical protein RI922_293 [Bacteroidota bacterium]|jgi:hypothetical protein